MTRRMHSDDPELRALLDSIGLRSTADLTDDDPATRERAGRDLQRILSQHRDQPNRRLSRRRIALAGVAIAAACALIVVPLSLRHDAKTALSTTQPAMLHFIAPPRQAQGHPADHVSLSATVLDKLSYVAAAQPQTVGVREVQTYSWNGRNYELSNKSAQLRDPASIPVGRPALLRRLFASGGCTAHDTGCALTALAKVFSTYATSPRTAGALWHAVAQSRVITDLGTTHDRLGRSAVGLATPLRDGRQLILLADPTTGALLGTEIVEGANTPSARAVTFSVIRAATLTQATPEH